MKEKLQRAVFGAEPSFPLKKCIYCKNVTPGTRPTYMSATCRPCRSVKNGHKSFPNHFAEEKRPDMWCKKPRYIVPDSRKPMKKKQKSPPFMIVFMIGDLLYCFQICAMGIYAIFCGGYNRFYIDNVLLWILWGHNNPKIPQ